MDGPSWLTLIEERAPRLRAAGVLTLQIDGCTLTLDALPPTDPTPAVAMPDKGYTEFTRDDSDPLNDPALYGLPPGSRVPGFDVDPDPNDPDTQ